MAADMLADAQVSRKIAVWSYAAAITRGGSAGLLRGHRPALQRLFLVLRGGYGHRLKVDHLGVKHTKLNLFSTVELEQG